MSQDWPKQVQEAMRLHEPTKKADPEQARDRLALRGLPGGPARVTKGQAGQGESRRKAREMDVTGTKARMHVKKEECHLRPILLRDGAMSTEK